MVFHIIYMYIKKNRVLMYFDEDLFKNCTNFQVKQNFFKSEKKTIEYPGKVYELFGE